jgi:hypothetical protein
MFRAMPDLDLEPHEYAKRDPHSGRMVRAPSKRFARNLTIISALILAFVFWHRNEVEPWTLFGVTAMFAFFAGIFAANWLKDIY